MKNTIFESRKSNPGCYFRVVLFIDNMRFRKAVSMVKAVGPWGANTYVQSL